MLRSRSLIHKGIEGIDRVWVWDLMDLRLTKCARSRDVDLEAL